MSGYFVYFYGPPGAGKSTLVRELMSASLPGLIRKPFAHTEWLAPGGKVVELGGERDDFRGTDILPMNVQPLAVALVKSRPSNLMIAEGDRLANDAFFSEVERAGYALTTVYVNPPEAAEWCARRAEQLGKAQNAQWIKGRITKSASLAERWESMELTAADQDARLKWCAGLDNPVIAALRPTLGTE